MNRVLISGGGIGGLTAALALLRKGIDCVVCEQAPELREVGAGVQIAANGTRVLFELGLEAEVRRCGVEASGKEIRLWNTGAAWKLFDLGAASVERYGFPYFMLHRSDLHGMLADAVRQIKPDAIRLGERGTGFTEGADGVALLTEGGGRLEGAVLIGADGLHSRIRQQLFGAERAQFSGGVAWRGLVQMELLADHQRRSVGSNWIGPHGHVITYPVRPGLLNFVGHVERDDWQVESWTEQGAVEECLADFEGWHEDIQRIIRNIETPFRWALFLREPLQQWGRGRVSLLGDACHATLPYLAQGANMAIEDGFVLARCLEAGWHDPAAALRRYQDARCERTTQIVRRSAANLSRFHHGELADARDGAAYVDREWHPDKVTERYDWLFRYDALNVPLDAPI